MKLRITYGIDKVLEGLFYHEQHIIDDIKLLAAEPIPAPIVTYPSGNTLGVDTEYDPDGELITLGFANGKAAIARDITDKAYYPSTASVLLDEASYLVGHNIPGDIDQLAKAGLRVKEDWYAGRKLIDTFVLAKLLDENKPRGSYGLEQLTLTAYNTKPWKAETDAKLKETGDARDWTPEERETRCRTDSWATFMLAKKFYPLLVNSAQPRLLVETMHRISMTLYRIGLAGAKVDKEYLYTFKTATNMHMSTREIALRTMAVEAGWDKQEPFIPTKDDDIRYLLFDKLGIDPISYTKHKKPSVDKINLKQYAQQGVGFIPTLLEYNQLQKIDSVYGDIEEHIDKQGYLHFWINQLGTRTGRRSSGGENEGVPSSKNAQNWPPDAKHMIVSRFRGGSIGAFDYQSLEPILASWLSQDSNLFDFFYNGRGYLDICKRVLHQDIDKTSKIYRAIKNMTLGIFYNMQEPKMSSNLWKILDFKFSEDYSKHRKQTEKVRNQILGLFPGWVRYMEKQKIELAQTGKIVCADGYTRHLPHHGERSERYWALTNQAINTPVQHLASMVTGCAMIDCEAAMLACEGMTYREWQSMLREQATPSMPILINEVHDELTWDLPVYSQEYQKVILDTMAEPPSLKKLIPGFDIKLKIEPKISERW